jgi:predicted dinucleotide-binding enzyme
MKYAIIGSGKIGTALANIFARKEYRSRQRKLPWT